MTDQEYNDQLSKVNSAEELELEFPIVKEALHSVFRHGFTALGSIVGTVAAVNPVIIDQWVNSNTVIFAGVSTVLVTTTLGVTKVLSFAKQIKDLF